MTIGRIAAYLRGYEPSRSDALIAFTGTRIAAYKAPEEIVVLDAMPINNGGKVDRLQLAATALRRGFTTEAQRHREEG